MELFKSTNEIGKVIFQPELIEISTTTKEETKNCQSAYFKNSKLELLNLFFEATQEFNKLIKFIKARNLLSVDVVKESVKNHNTIVKDYRKYLEEFDIGQNIPKPDVMIIDPPRSGMNPKTVKDVIQLLPSKIVYVSCNPTTQARDIKLLSEVGYKLQKIRPVDMFPHTHHIENVALLVK